MLELLLTAKWKRRNKKLGKTAIKVAQENTRRKKNPVELL